jgi:CRP-like cAMP-binding protein
MEVEEALKSVPLFSGLEQRYIAPLAKLAHERLFAAGDYIIREGEEGIALYVIVAGDVEVVQHRLGGDVRLRHMGPGEVFGELALLTAHTRTATVRAVEPTTCLVITSITFQGLLDASPEIGKVLSKTIARWLVETEDRIQIG